MAVMFPRTLSIKKNSGPQGQGMEEKAPPVLTTCLWEALPRSEKECSARAVCPGNGLVLDPAETHTSRSVMWS